MTAQSNKSLDVRAKQRLCLLAYPLNFNGLGGGFAPRHLSRSAAILADRNCVRKKLR